MHAKIIKSLLFKVPKIWQNFKFFATKFQGHNTLVVG